MRGTMLRVTGESKMPAEAPVAMVLTKVVRPEARLGVSSVGAFHQRHRHPWSSTMKGERAVDVPRSSVGVPC